MAEGGVKVKRLAILFLTIFIACVTHYNRAVTGFSSMAYTNTNGEVSGLYLGDMDVTEEYEKYLNKMILYICHDLKTDQEKFAILGVTLLEDKKISVEIYFEKDKHTYSGQFGEGEINHYIDKNYKLDEWEKIRIEGDQC